MHIYRAFVACSKIFANTEPTVSLAYLSHGVYPLKWSTQYLEKITPCDPSSPSKCTIQLMKIGLQQMFNDYNVRVYCACF